MSLVFLQWIAWVLVPGSIMMLIVEAGDRFGHSVVSSKRKRSSDGKGRKSA
jgi:hypothetical protein